MSDDEFERMQKRIQNQNDVQQTHTLQVANHEFRLVQLESTTRNIQMTMVTGDGLKDTLALITLKIEGLSSQIEPLRKAIYWAATLIVGAVILALFGQLLK